MDKCNVKNFDTCCNTLVIFKLCNIRLFNQM